MRSLHTTDDMSGSDEASSAARDEQDKHNSTTEADATLVKDSAHSANAATPVDDKKMSDKISSSATPVKGEQGTNDSSTDAEAILNKDSAHSERGVTSVGNQKMIDSAASPAQGEQNADHSRSDSEARLDRVLKHYHGIAMAANRNSTSATHPSSAADATLDLNLAHSQKGPVPAHNNEMSNNVISLARTRRRRGKTTHNYSSTQEADKRLDGVRADSEQGSTPADNHEISEHESITSLMRRARESNARLEQVLAHCLEGATPVHAPPSASMAYTREEVFTKDQSASTLFRLPPELRDTIYTYVFHGKYGLPQFQWDEQHDSPKLSLKCAQPRAPPNELLRTCRSIYKESKGIFVAAKTQFWSDTTFTLAIESWLLPSSFCYLECLLNEQVSHMTRVNIVIQGSRSFTVHLRSGPEADSSVTYSTAMAGCTHRRSLPPPPLNLVERVVEREQAGGHLSCRDIGDILWQGGRCPDSSWVPLCVECHTEPVVLSVQTLSRAGLMAVVAWTCRAPGS